MINRASYVKVSFITLILCVMFAPMVCSAQLAVSIDPLVDIPHAFEKTPNDIEALFNKRRLKRSPYFSWLNRAKDRAIFKRNLSRNTKIDLTMLNGKVPLEEVIVDFDQGQYLGLTVSVFNRGDGGQLSQAEFHRRNTLISQYLTERLGTKPKLRSGNYKKRVMTSGYTWKSSKGKAVLDYNIEAPGNIEFVRLRISPAHSGGIYRAALKDRSQAEVRTSALSKNVVRRQDGAVYISNFPMVDQGSKGYCVVASAQRLFEYYGIACDMHQLAHLAGSDPRQGTNTLLINKQLSAIDHIFKTRFTCLAVSFGKDLVELKDNQFVGDVVPAADVQAMIKKNIDDGIPLLWSLTLGKAVERPNMRLQSSGGHMRLIIGYNEQRGEVIFSDSWGMGHEFKTMKAADLYRVTTGLFLMKPAANWFFN